METMVLNMMTGEENFYSTNAIDSLVTQAIMGDNKSMQISNKITRDKYTKKILFGQKSASIGDYAVLI